jgi:hypothetical protein
MKLELTKCKDDKIRLYYWDNIHGNDAILRINPDGSAILETYDRDGKEMLVQIDYLNKELIHLAEVEAKEATKEGRHAI